MKLLPCPFCGSEAVVSGQDLPEPCLYVACSRVDCFCCVGEAYTQDGKPDHCFGSEAEAIAAWNRRPLMEVA